MRTVAENTTLYSSFMKLRAENGSERNSSDINNTTMRAINEERTNMCALCRPFTSAIISVIKKVNGKANSATEKCNPAMVVILVPIRLVSTSKETKSADRMLIFSC